MDPKGHRVKSRLVVARGWQGGVGEGIGSDFLTGMGSPLRVMKMFWNQIEAKIVPHNEHACSKQMGSSTSQGKPMKCFNQRIAWSEFHF